MTQGERPIDRVVAALRADPVDLADDLARVRARFEQLGERDPLATGAESYRARIGGVSVLDIPVSPSEAPVVFVHSGGFIAGSAAGSFALARRLADTVGRRVVSVDYRLAPEFPFPAARDDVIAVLDTLGRGIAPERIAVVGASAGAAIALHALRELRDQGRGLPGAVSLLSPFTDLTLSGSSFAWNHVRDPSLTRSGLAAGARAYGASDSEGLRPTMTNLRGFPPLQVQVGSREILLSDSLDLVREAARADIPVSLEIWAEMVHVFPTFAAVLDEGATALRRIGTFLERWIPA
ncbi:alpha/beta fold hydrolase [Microbacterium schleiferi]|uniref:alpha/beta fold hydrolase n=1 Tax=Microbacterium schleiferi TaxID=69362 RepID=UPI00311DC34C